MSKILSRLTMGALLAAGVFGADMKVHLVNDGPVTFWLKVEPAPGKETA